MLVKGKTELPYSYQWVTAELMHQGKNTVNGTQRSCFVVSFFAWFVGCLFVCLRVCLLVVLLAWVFVCWWFVVLFGFCLVVVVIVVGLVWGFCLFVGFSPV